MWGLQKIEMPTAWNKTTGSKNVKVAVIDSGVDYKHADLAANVDVSLGYDFVDNDADPQDGKGHGTHVAGTIGAKANNGLGVPGINWNVTMVPIRILNNEGTGSVSNIVKGINWATQKKIPIANYSISGDNYSSSIETAIKNYPGLFVGTAGNKGDSLESTPRYPSALIISNMITVGNSDQQDERYSSSGYSKTKVDLFAPGRKIYSTIPGGYGTKTGTSMAAPHVAGSAALALAQNPNLTTSQLKNKILNSVDKKASLSEFCQTGGRLNTAKLLD
jgi:subtilisin family serine protease